MVTTSCTDVPKARLVYCIVQAQCTESTMHDLLSQLDQSQGLCIIYAFLAHATKLSFIQPVDLINAQPQLSNVPVALVQQVKAIACRLYLRLHGSSMAKQLEHCALYATGCHNTHAGHAAIGPTKQSTTSGNCCHAVCTTVRVTCVPATPFNDSCCLQQSATPTRAY